MTPLVPIIMGSKSDLDHGTTIAAALTGYGDRERDPGGIRTQGGDLSA